MKYKVGDKVDYVGLAYDGANKLGGTIEAINEKHMFPYRVDFSNGYIHPCYEEELILHKKPK